MLTGKEWEQVCRNSPEVALVQILGSNMVPEAIYAAQAELVRRTNAFPCSNLDKWWEELAAGVRDAYAFDDLWRAACDERNQMEWDAVLRRRPPTPSHPHSVDDDL